VAVGHRQHELLLRLGDGLRRERRAGRLGIGGQVVARRQVDGVGVLVDQAAFVVEQGRDDDVVLDRAVELWTPDLVDEDS